MRGKSGGRNGGGENPGETLPPVDFDVVALDDALEGLQQLEPRLAQVIEWHYFGGLTYDQIAAAVGTSAATVHPGIRLASAWSLTQNGGNQPPCCAGDHGS